MKWTDILLIKYLQPSAFIKSIYDLNIEDLINSGIQMLICDLDNTLVPHFSKFPNKQAHEFCQKIKQAGIKFVVVSNNTYKRVNTFCELLEPDDFIYNAKKPTLKKIKALLRKYNLSPTNVVMIGDQFITDVFAANRLHAKSILTLPIISLKAESNSVFRNWLEKYIYKKLNLNNMVVKSKKEEVVLKYEIF